jgi:AraC family transcriptional regulator
MHIELTTLPPMRWAYMRHTGPYGDPAIPDLWQRFAAWCDARGLMRPRPRFYGIGQDDPALTPAGQCRYDACVEVPPDFQPGADAGIQHFAGGRYACARFVGRPEDFPAAWHRLHAELLPASPWRRADKPGLEIYEQDFAVDPATGAFPCLLAVPVRPR